MISGSSVVASLAVLVDIKTFLLDALVATQAVGLLDDVEENEGDNECEGCYRKSAKCLHSDRELYTVNGRVSECACQHSSEETAYTVHRDSTYRVVNLELLVYEAY